MSNDNNLTALPSSLSAERFVELFGSVYEHSSWVAERTHAKSLGDKIDSLDGLASEMALTMDEATQEEQLTLIQAHPDLAGKAAAAGTLTNESNLEQSSAGLDQCTEAELAEFHKLNKKYKASFNIPFIMAVKDSNRHLILAAFKQRMDNSLGKEFQTALNEIDKIARFRLQAFFPDSNS